MNGFVHEGESVGSSANLHISDLADKPHTRLTLQRNVNARELSKVALNIIIGDTNSMLCQCRFNTFHHRRVVISFSLI